MPTTSQFSGKRVTSVGDRYPNVSTRRQQLLHHRQCVHRIRNVFDHMIGGNDIERMLNPGNGVLLKRAVEDLNATIASFRGTVDAWFHTFNFCPELHCNAEKESGAAADV